MAAVAAVARCPFGPFAIEVSGAERHDVRVAGVSNKSKSTIVVEGKTG